MGIEQVMDSVQKIVKRWCVNSVPLIQDASAGDSTIYVKSTVRFLAGDEIMLRDPTDETGEIDLYISEVVDETTLTLSRELASNWEIGSHAADTPVVEKLYNTQYVKGVYIGDPSVVPMFPAITVNPISSQSEWLTLDSTKETYNIQLGVYMLDSNQEDTFRFMMKMVDIIQHGLKQHIYPLVAPYTTTALTEDIIQTGSPIYNIKVADANIFEVDTLHRMILEDPYKTEEFVVTKIINSTTIRVNPPVCHSYYVDDGTIAINATRFMFNSWPNNINYGKVFKGSMLKAATIDWFAWEENIQTAPPRSPNII